MIQTGGIDPAHRTLCTIKSSAQCAPTAKTIQDPQNTSWCLWCRWWSTHIIEHASGKYTLPTDRALVPTYVNQRSQQGLAAF